MIATVAAYLRRDARLARAHPAAFLLDVVNLAFSAITFALIARIVAPRQVPGSYLAFAMTGLALMTLLSAGITVVANGMRDEQVQGTLEAIVVAGVPTHRMALGMSAYPLLSAGVRAAVYVTLAGILGARAPQANWPLATTGALLGAASFAGIGLIAASASLIVRQSTAITAWLTSMAALAAGALFPERVLPEWVRAVAQVSPFTHALRLVRGAVLEGASWAADAGALLRLGLLAVIWVAAGIGALTAALRYASRTGKLASF